MADTILEEIKAAQAAPTDNYMVWAEFDGEHRSAEIVLETVRLPQTIPVESIFGQIRGHAARLLNQNGFTEEQIKTAKFHIVRLPSAEEAEAELRAKASPGSLVLADFPFWETCRWRLNLKPEVVDGELEMDYKGIKIRRSAAS
jgi:hypothetical protein